MPEPTITYASHANATSLSEVSVLAAIYKLAISSYERKEAAAESRPDDAKGRSKSDSSARSSIHQWSAIPTRRRAPSSESLA